MIQMAITLYQVYKRQQGASCSGLAKALGRWGSFKKSKNLIVTWGTLERTVYPSINVNVGFSRGCGGFNINISRRDRSSGYRVRLRYYLDLQEGFSDLNYIASHDNARAAGCFVEVVIRCLDAALLFTIPLLRYYFQKFALRGQKHIIRPEMV